jgi:predicted nucleic acid-binding protein
VTATVGISTVRYLVDTSAIVQLPRDSVAAVLSPLLSTGQLATCAVVDLALYAAVRDPAALADLLALRAASFHWLPTTDADLIRAIDVYAELAGQGQHRVGWPDLVVAAVAERHQVALLHYNASFEQIAKVTGQSVEWVVAESRTEGVDPP